MGSPYHRQGSHHPTSLKSPKNYYERSSRFPPTKEDSFEHDFLQVFSKPSTEFNSRAFAGHTAGGGASVSLPFSPRCRSRSKVQTSDLHDGRQPAGCCTRLYYRLKIVPEKVLLRVARQDAQAVQQALRFFPLSFRKMEVEHEYNESRRTSQKLRCWVVATLSAAVVLLFWISYLLAFRAHKKYSPFVKQSETYFHAGMAISLLGCLLFALVESFEKSCQHSGLLSIFFLILICVGPTFWVLATSGTTTVYKSLDPNLEVAKYVAGTVIRHHAFYLLLVSIFIIPLFAVNLLLTIRFTFSFALHIALVGLFTACGILIVTTSRNLAPPGVREIGFFVIHKVSITLEIIVFCMTAAFAFLAGCYKSLIDRVEWFRWKTSVDLLHALRQRQEIEEGNRDEATTAIELITNFVERAKDALVEAQHSSSQIAFIESNDLLERKTENLYSLTMGRDSGERQSAQQKYQSQLLAIYGGQAVVQHGSPVARHSLLADDEVKSREYRRFPRISAASMVAKVVKPEIECQIGINLQMNLLEYHEAHAASALEEIGYILLRDSLQVLESTPEILHGLLSRIAQCYFPNPYHNQAHAVAVAHVLVCLIRDFDCIIQSTEFDDIHFAIAVLAALGHDLCHPGRSNSYFVGKTDNVAIVWNDKSVLENLHSAVLCKILQQKECNIFASFDYNRFLSMRGRLIQLILATDMALHFEYMGRVKVRLGSPDFDTVNNFDDLWMIVKQCLKAADLNHAFMPWEQHFSWSLRVCEEFYQQGDEEKKKGLPVSPLCCRSAFQDLPKGQAGFIKFVVQPLLEQLTSLPGLHGLEQQCLVAASKNLRRWCSMVSGTDFDFHNKFSKGSKYLNVRKSSCATRSDQEHRKDSAALDPISSIIPDQLDEHHPGSQRLVIPPYVSAMKTNSRPLWNVFVDIMSAKVPEPLPHIQRALMEPRSN